MKSLLALTGFFFALALTGCATSGDYTAYLNAQTAIETSRHNAEADKYRAMAEITANGSDAARVAAAASSLDFPMTK